MIQGTHENIFMGHVYNMEYEYERACCVRGYHVYQDIWEAAVGEVLECEREPRNVKDRIRVRASDGAYCCFAHTFVKLSRKVTASCCSNAMMAGVLYLL